MHPRQPRASIHKLAHVSVMAKPRPLRFSTALLLLLFLLLALVQIPGYARNATQRLSDLHTDAGAGATKPAIGNESIHARETQREQNTKEEEKNNQVSLAALTTGKPSYNLEMRWARNNFADRVCRIHNACIDSAGGVAVHPWMKAHARHLAACGVMNVTYLNPASPPPFLALDLFGHVAARFHIPHFLTDVLPMIYASTLLRERHSISATGEVHAVCETPRRARCTRAALHAALLVEPRVLEMGSDQWVPELSRLLPGMPQLVSPPPSGNGMRCFRSVVAYKRSSFIRQGRGWYSLGNGFRRAGITRDSIVGKCKLSVVILNRVGWMRRAGFLLGRDIVNIGDVVHRIREEGPRYGLNVSVKIAYFENRTFSEQVKIMQEADALVGVHGAGLGNLLFAKQDVAFLEVMPFGYYAGPFDRVATALHLNYSRVIAEPDNDGFLDCLKRRAARAKSGEEDTLGADVGMWNHAVEKWRKDGRYDVLLCHLFTDPRKSSMKICSRGQRMRVDVELVTQRLLRMAQGVCARKPQ